MDKPAGEGQLQRRLGSLSAVMITVGAVIGSGIFMKPLQVAHAVPDPMWIYGLWIALGVVCLFGAFAYAELGTLFPNAGGQYSFLRQCFGAFPAFLYGWCFFWVINSGTMAALAIGFADNLMPWLGFGADHESFRMVKMALAAGMILVLATVNHFGVGVGALVQNLSTLAKLAALGLIVVAGFVVAVTGSNTVVASAPAMAPDMAPDIRLSGIIVACVAIFWAYEGWYQLPFNAAELRHPERDLPRGLVVGLFILIGTYLLMNAVYLQSVPLAEMLTLDVDTQKLEVPARTVARVYSPELAGYLTLLIAISVFGAANPNLLSSPRAFYEMAREGALPRVLMHISPRWGTPTVSIWMQTAWAIGLVLGFEHFDDTTAYVVFASLIFYALTVAGVYVARRRFPGPRIYKCFGYPITPALFIVTALFVDWQTLLDADERNNALIGLGIIATGVPFYFLMRRRASTV